MEYITSRKNAHIAHIRKLISSRAYRRETGQMVCEGPKMLEEALRWGAEITQIVQTQKASVPANLPPGVQRLQVLDDLLAWLSDTKTPQNSLFLCRIPESPPLPCETPRFLVLDGVQDPGNVGTIWRTADAFGAAGLILLGACADPWSPKTLRATMGAAFRLPVWEMEAQSLVAQLKEREIPLYGAALMEDTLDIQALSLHKAAVVIGSEGRGISDEVLARCEKTIKIPMAERCESLNAAVAASVVLWEMAR